MLFANALFNSVIKYILGAVVAIAFALVGIALAKRKARNKREDESK